MWKQHHIFQVTTMHAGSHFRVTTHKQSLSDKPCTFGARHVPCMQQPDVVLNNAVVYTDGACDNTRDPYAARAAWAAILRTPTDTQIETENAMWKFKVLAAGHCPGHQTISRSELYAMVIAVELIATEPSASHVRFVTDSQYVVNCIHQIEDETIFACPNKKNALGLNSTTSHCLEPSKFYSTEDQVTSGHHPGQQTQRRHGTFVGMNSRTRQP